MALTWNAPLPDNGKTPIVVGDPGHDTMHNEVVDCITEIRTNVDTVNTTAGAPAWTAITGKPTAFPTASADITDATTVGKAVLTAASAAAAATAVGATTTGAALLTAASKTAAATAVSAGTIGSGVLDATTTTAARTALGSLSGVATLVAGTVAVSAAAITATSPVLLTPMAAPQGTVYVSAVTAATGFTITSTNTADAIKVAWQVLV